MIKAVIFDLDGALYPNSYEYDILGAKNVSMKAAFFSKKNINFKETIDFIFHDYKDLREYIRLNI